MDSLVGGNGFDIPQDVLDFNATQRNDGAVNAIDPDFEIPSQYRWNLGIKHTLPFDIEMTADFIYSRVHDEVLWQDIRLQQIGTAPDGRPIYGPRPDGRTNASIQDFLLTNTHEGESTVYSIDASKTWRTGAGRFDAYLGYGHQDVKDVNPGTSSTASSNWDNVAVSDPNDPRVSTSNYEIEHRFVGTFEWTRAFFRDYETQPRPVRRAPLGPAVQLHLRRRHAAGRLGRPAPGCAPAPALLCAGRRRDLRGAVLGGGCRERAWQAARRPRASRRRTPRRRPSLRTWMSYIQQQGLEHWRGRIMPRNSHRSPWASVLDLRISQDLPVFRRTRGVLTFDIENFANLLNNDWGQLRQVSFPYVAPVVDVNRIATHGLPERRGELLRLSPALGRDGAGQAIRDDCIAAFGMARSSWASASSSDDAAGKSRRSARTPC